MDPDDPVDARIVAVEQALRAKGWAEHTSLSRELSVWDRLGRRVSNYSMTVDDYTNDLCSRDYLDQALARLPPELSESVSGLVATLDEAFREGTTSDDDGLLGRFFRIASRDGWWWRRIPSAGPLADYLVASRRR